MPSKVTARLARKSITYQLHLPHAVNYAWKGKSLYALGYSPIEEQSSGQYDEYKQHNQNSTFQGDKCNANENHES